MSSITNNAPQYLLGESGIVVVLNEVSKECRISAVRSDRVNHVIQITDAPAGTLKCIKQLVVTFNSELAW